MSRDGAEAFMPRDGTEAFVLRDGAEAFMPRDGAEAFVLRDGAKAINCAPRRHRSVSHVLELLGVNVACVWSVSSHWRIRTPFNGT